jgi:hypothetical protein
MKVLPFSTLELFQLLTDRLASERARYVDASLAHDRDREDLQASHFADLARRALAAKKLLAQAHAIYTTTAAEE